MHDVTLMSTTLTSTVTWLVMERHSDVERISIKCVKANNIVVTYHNTVKTSTNYKFFFKKRTAMPHLFLLLVEDVTQLSAANLGRSRDL